MADEPHKEAIEAFYTEAVRQYDLVVKSLDGLNNKAIGVIAFNGTLLSLFSLSVVQFVKSSTNLNLQLFLIGVALSYFLIILSIIYAAYAFRVVTICSISPGTLQKEYYLHERCEVLNQLCSNISEAVDENNGISKDKRSLINSSLVFSVLGVIFICATLVYGFTL